MISASQVATLPIGEILSIVDIKTDNRQRILEQHLISSSSFDYFAAIDGDPNLFFALECRKKKLI